MQTLDTDTSTRKKNNIDEQSIVLASIFEKYREDPVFFVEHFLGHYTWSKQREILSSVAKNKKTIVKASHSVSKTYTSAELVVWFLNCFKNSKIITTAPTFRQVRDLLWTEIGKIYRTSRYALDGDCSMVSIRTDNTEHFALGFSSEKASYTEGFHAPEILFVFDEAKGIEQWLWNSVRGSMTGGYCRWLVVSTTDGVKVGEEFYNIFCNKNDGWNKISISAYDSPLITGEKLRTIEVPDDTRPDVFYYKYIEPEKLNMQIASKSWINACEREWGKASVLYRTKVCGEIVDIGSENIVKYTDVLKMFENYDDENFETEGDIEIGVDVARMGEDSTVIFKRKGMKVIDYKILQKLRINEIVDVVRTMADNKDIAIKIDDTGVGGGVTDMLLKEGYNVVAINFGQKANNPDKYPNAISEMWFEVANTIKDIACPRIERLMVELVNRRFAGIDKQGRREIESKETYKKRGFASPDVADSFLLCFYNTKSLRIL